MNAIETVALNKAASKLEGSVPVGKHEVDFTVTVAVKGTINKSPDTQYTPTADIPLKEALALALRYCGVTREAAKVILVKAMTEALNGNGEFGEFLPEIDAALAHVQSITEALPKKTRNGAVRTNLVLTVLEPEETVGAVVSRVSEAAEVAMHG